MGNKYFTKPNSRHLLLALFFFVGSLWAKESTCALHVSTTVGAGHSEGSAFVAMSSQPFQDNPLFLLQDSLSLGEKGEAIVPCSASIELANPYWETRRRSVLFFFCDQYLQMTAKVSVIGLPDSIPPFQTTLMADTSLDVGYCGILERSARPLSAMERLTSEKYLYQKLIQQLRQRLNLFYPKRK